MLARATFSAVSHALRTARAAGASSATRPLRMPTDSTTPCPRYRGTPSYTSTASTRVQALPISSTTIILSCFCPIVLTRPAPLLPDAGSCSQPLPAVRSSCVDLLSAQLSSSLLSFSVPAVSFSPQQHPQPFCQQALRTT